MGIYVNPGNKKFKEALCSEIYVDKSMLLQYTNRLIGTTRKAVCVSRPRRFGKSIAADMLAAYYDKSCDSGEMFQNLKIAETADYEEHRNRYNVIYVDMNDFRHRLDNKTGEMITATTAVGLFHSVIIAELKQQFQVSVMEESLPAVLAAINEMCGAEFIIIIDEWDTIFREDKEDIKAQKLYISLLRGLFKDSNSKNYLKLAYITGILPIKKYGTESALNNFREYTMLNPGPLADFAGFTGEEVRDLCERYHMDFEMAQKWYDGYSFRRLKHVYNPNSVVNAMMDEEYSNYWGQTETYESLKGYISLDFDGLKSAVVEMLAGGRCKVDTSTFDNDMTNFGCRDDILTVLIHLGYLAYDQNSKEAYIPNEEVKSSFAGAIRKTDWEQVVRAITASDKLLQATWEQDAEAVAKGIDKVHAGNVSILEYNDENALSCVISLAYYNAVNEYTLVREMPAGKGYADIVFLPRKYSDKPAMIVELKYNQSAEGAVTQIKEKNYVRALEAYKGKILLVGINYDRNTKVHECKIEQIER